MTFNRSAFMDAWTAWDEYPGDPIRTDRKVTQTSLLAESVGLTLPQATGVLQAWRRCGFTRHRSLEAFLAGVRASDGSEFR